MRQHVGGTQGRGDDAVTQAGDAGLALVAWMVAGSFALAAGGAAFGFSAYRRRKAAEMQLRVLESAVREFCGALRARVAAESVRSGAREARPEAERRAREPEGAAARQERPS